MRNILTHHHKERHLTQNVNPIREFNDRKYRLRPDGVGFTGLEGSAKKEA